MNEYDSVQPAYEEGGPKEVNVKRGMPGGDKQFGKHKMPQNDKPMLHPKLSHYGHHRHKEYR